MESVLNLTEYFRSGSDLILLFLSIYIFLAWNKPAGILIFYYSISSTLFILSLHKMFGLGFIAEMLSRSVGEPVTFKMLAVNCILSAAEPALVIGIILLVIQMRSNKAGKK